eukprot:7382451-Prymnesium_polylepis.1
MLWYCQWRSATSGDAGPVARPAPRKSTSSSQPKAVRFEPLLRGKRGTHGVGLRATRAQHTLSATKHTSSATVQHTRSPRERHLRCVCDQIAKLATRAGAHLAGVKLSAAICAITCEQRGCAV